MANIKLYSDSLRTFYRRILPSLLRLRSIFHRPPTRTSQAIAILAHLLQTASNPPTDVSALESSTSVLERAISALESEVKALEIRSVPWEYSVWVFTFLVVIGVALEFWVIRHDWRDEMEEWALGHFGIIRLPGRPSLLKLRIEIASLVLITLGVAGEFAVGIEITSINGLLRGKSAELRSKNADLRSKSDQLLALVTQQAGDAILKAGLADERAAKLEKEAAKLRKKAEDETTARIQVEARVAWRRLTKDQISKLGEQLSPFVGEPTSLLFNVSDAEADSFGRDVGAALHAASWGVGDPWPVEEMRGGTAFGKAPPADTGVRIRSTKNKISHDAADALIKRLIELGFDAFRSEEIPYTQRMVEVMIERRPEGAQGQLKLKALKEHK